MSRSSNEASTSPKLAEPALESSEEAVSDSSRRMEKVIRGQNSVQTVVSVTQIPQAESALSQLRGGYGLNGDFWTGPGSCMLILLAVFFLGYLAATPTLLLGAFIEP